LFCHLGSSFTSGDPIPQTSKPLNLCSADTCKYLWVIERLIGLVLLGISVLLMAFVSLVWTTAVGSFGLGFGVAFIITPAQVLMQGKTPPEMLGRVSSSFMSVIAMAQMLGLVISGSAAEKIGLRALFYACAALLGVLALVGYWRMPRLDNAQPVTQ